LKQKLKILFRTAGGKAPKRQLGLGHVFRCINLAKNLKSNEIYFLIEDYEGVKKLLRDNGFNRIFLIKNDISTESDIKETIHHIIQKKIDILIIDKYKVKSKYLKKIRKFVKVVVVTGLTKFEFPADLIVNGYIGLNNKIISNKYRSKCMLGPSYQILNSNFAKRILQKKEYDLLATFGGFDEKKIIELLLKSLNKYEKSIKTKIILGPATILTKNTLKFLKKMKNVTIIKQTKDMQKEMATSKYGICSGGLTTYEFANMGIPFAIICQVNHQLITAREWQRKGVALNLGLVGNKTVNKIEGFLEYIIENNLPIKVKKRSLIDGLGSKRVAQEILKLKD